MPGLYEVVAVTSIIEGVLLYLGLVLSPRLQCPSNPRFRLGALATSLAFIGFGAHFLTTVLKDDSRVSLPVAIIVAVVGVCWFWATTSLLIVTDDWAQILQAISILLVCVTMVFAMMQHRDDQALGHEGITLALLLTIATGIGAVVAEVKYRRRQSLNQ